MTAAYLLAVLLTRCQLPDLEFPVNGMAEGRILVPWESRVRSNLTMQSNLGEYALFRV